tara:strand:+ start:324 stop:854 length:531 start_codon:yes stop_codon:yes gene_type:complete
VSDLVCELVKEDDPFLKEIPEAFDFDNPQVDSEKLVDQIKENMIHHRGVGLSANQIGIPLKVFGFLFDDKITVTFNQEILEWSEETIYMREGCLSFPGLYFPVTRAETIAVHFQSFDGEEQAGSLTGLSSIVYQHEMEHMNGDLFTQNASKFKLRQSMKKRDKYLNKINKQKGKNA